MSRITEGSVIVATDRQVSSDLGGEAVILHLGSGVYFGLNSVGASIWALLREPRTVRELEKAVLAEYAVDAERCRSDILRLLRSLEAEDLVEVRESEALGLEAESAADR